MLSYFRLYRERGWHPISATEYRAAWLRWGGSVATHPDVVERLADLAWERASADVNLLSAPY